MVKMGGHIKPSPFALTLIDEVPPFSAEHPARCRATEPFDPATSTRVFRIAVPAFSTLLSAVFERVHAAAPSVSVEWLLPNLHAPPAVAEGQIDWPTLAAEAVCPMESMSTWASRSLG